MTTFNDYEWGTIGKIPADDDFFGGDFDVNDVMTGSGFTPGYSKLLGEQVFKLTEPSEHPFTDRLTGRPIMAGAGWVERLVKRAGIGTMPVLSSTSGTPSTPAQTGMFKRGVGSNGTYEDADNVKFITADDDLRFYDSAGKEFAYPSDNYRGWIPVSLPSNLDLFDEFSEGSKMGELNGMLVDNVKQTYDNALETAIQEKAVNLCPYYDNAGTVSGKELFTEIRDYVSKMRSDDFAFNQFAITNGTLATADPTFNTDYEHKAKDVVIFMSRITYNAMMDDFATYPSPEFIKDIGADFVLMDNEMVTPYATKTAMQTAGFTDWGGLNPAKDMPMLGKAAPKILIMDRRFCEYRPVIDSYRINVSKNGAGDFVNEHMHFVGGLNVKPWASCVAIGNITFS